MHDPTLPHSERKWYRHRPPHHFERGKALFITASTHRRVRHLQAPARKDEFLEVLAEASRQFEVDLHAWVVLDDHYHLIIHPEHPGSVSRWLGVIHGTTSRAWNEQDRCPGRQGWYQFWDKALWTDGDLWSRINYIHGNPVKHGYVEDPRDWPWSSIHRFDAVWEDEEVHRLRDRFPAPRKLPYDDF